MKQNLEESQTAKLIEMGFEKPKNRLVKQRFVRSTSSWIVVGEEGDYYIGELLSFLPENIAKENEMPSTLNISLMNGEWCVQYADFLGTDFEFCNTELVDALYDMLVKLKEKGVI